MKSIQDVMGGLDIIPFFIPFGSHPSTNILMNIQVFQYPGFEYLLRVEL